MQYKVIHCFCYIYWSKTNAHLLRKGCGEKESESKRELKRHNGPGWDMNAITLSVTVPVNVYRTHLYENPILKKPLFFCCSLCSFPHSSKTNTSSLHLILWMGPLKLTRSGKALKKETTKHTHAKYVHPKDICLTSLALQHSSIFPPQILTFSNLLYCSQENRNDTNG